MLEAPHITGNVSLGQILTLVTVGAGYIATWVRQNERQEVHTKVLADHTEQMKLMEKALAQIAITIEKQSVVTEYQAKDIARLRDELERKVLPRL